MLVEFAPPFRPPTAFARSATRPWGNVVSTTTTAGLDALVLQERAAALVLHRVVVGGAPDGLVVSEAAATVVLVDTVPAQFTFTDQTNVTASSQITSVGVQITGLAGAAVITVTGGTYAISDDNSTYGSYTSSPGTVTNNQYVRARHTASASASTAVNTVVTINGVSDTFTSTTAAAAGYDFTLTATGDDGMEDSIYGWDSGFCSCSGLIAGEGESTIGAWSFPNVALTTCSAATLTLNVSYDTSGAGTFKVRGRTTASSANAQWGVGNLPSAATAVASEVTGITHNTGAKVLNVTTMVQQIMAGAQWVSGARMNFWAVDTDVNLYVDFGQVGTGTPARLQITP